MGVGGGGWGGGGGREGRKKAERPCHKVSKKNRNPDGMFYLLWL